MNIVENKTNRKELPSFPGRKTRISQEKAKKSKRRGLLDSEAWAVWISAPLSTVDTNTN